MRKSIWIGAIGALLLSVACTADDKGTDPVDTPEESDPLPDTPDETPDTEESDTVDPDTPDTETDTPDTDETPLDSDDTPAGDTTDTAAVDSVPPGETGVVPPPDPEDTSPPPFDSTDGCGAFDIPDCDGECANPFLLEDGVCHDGSIPGMPNFDCFQYDFDGGACVEDTDDAPCPDPLDVRDCDGACYPQTWIGDGNCDDGTAYPHGNPNFLCTLHFDDLGDCNGLAP